MGTKDDDAWPNPNDQPKAPSAPAPPPSVVHVVHHHPPPVYYYAVPGPRKESRFLTFLLIAALVVLGGFVLAFFNGWFSGASEAQEACGRRGLRAANSPDYDEIKRRCEANEYSFPD